MQIWRDLRWRAWPTRQRDLAEWLVGHSKLLSVLLMAVEGKTDNRTSSHKRTVLPHILTKIGPVTGMILEVFSVMDQLPCPFKHRCLKLFLQNAKEGGRTFFRAYVKALLVIPWLGDRDSWWPSLIGQQWIMNKILLNLGLFQLLDHFQLSWTVTINVQLRTCFTCTHCWLLLVPIGHFSPLPKTGLISFGRVIFRMAPQRSKVLIDWKNNNTKLYLEGP